MRHAIPISIDDRRFTIWEWLLFLFIFTFIILHFAAFASFALGAAWHRVWVGDFIRTDLIRAVGHSTLSVLALIAFYAPVYLALSYEPFIRGSILLDTPEDRLILKRRHISGISRRKLLPLTDIRDIGVVWEKTEDGKDVPKLVLIPSGRPVHPAITNRADAADLPSFAARLRADLASAGWSDPTEHRGPKGEAASA